MLHEQGMFVAPRGSGTQHKSLRCSRLCILLSCLSFLEERGKPESAASLSLWAELLSWWLLRLTLGLPQPGPAIEQLKGCHLFPFWRRWLGRPGKRGFFQAEGNQWGSAAGRPAHQNLHLQQMVSNQTARCIQCLQDQHCAFWRWAVISVSTGASNPLCRVLSLRGSAFLYRATRRAR